MAIKFDTMIYKIKECLERQKQIYKKEEAIEIISDFKTAIETYIKRMDEYNEKAFKERLAERRNSRTDEP